MPDDLVLTPYTVHEADLAVYHAWMDGLPLRGPAATHLASGVLLRYRASLRISQAPEHAIPSSFGDWRAPSHGSGTTWSIESSAPLGAVTDAAVPISTFIPPGANLVIVIRFRCSNTGQWRIFQFHDCQLDTSDAADSSQVMLTGYRFTAHWLEEFGGNASDFMPSLDPRIFGTVEWCHAGRRIPCLRYEPVTDAWTETAENAFADASGQPAKLVTLETISGVTLLSYVAPRTEPVLAGFSGLDATYVGWMNAYAFAVDPLGSSGLTLQPGWQLQTGAPEPLTLPPSGRHWDHSFLRFRYLGRLYATLGYGIFAVPARIDAAPDRPIDPPFRLGRLILLPEAAHILPAA